MSASMVGAGKINFSKTIMNHLLKDESEILVYGTNHHLLEAEPKAQIAHIKDTPVFPGDQALKTL
ncbi:MAG: hypothetical protein HQ508_07320 [Candidatus Marinimicrobia bacterium]|nr:hypothetical protein [Candidatus Neomarinimicrobiota bacterium]